MLEEASPHARRVITIYVSTECNPEDLYYEDCEVPGDYLVDVPTDMDDGTAAACALGGFHSQVAIKRLYDFDIIVCDGETGAELSPNYELDIYDLADQAGRVYCT